jgi:hypothetical protein
MNTRHNQTGKAQVFSFRAGKAAYRKIVVFAYQAYSLSSGAA